MGYWENDCADLYLMRKHFFSVFAPGSEVMEPDQDHELPQASPSKLPMRGVEGESSFKVSAVAV